jgi:hypothetical protein
MKSYSFSERQIHRLLKAMIQILVLCMLFTEPVLAQVGNRAREEQSSGGRPDLSGIPANERNAIENACNYTRQFRGPAEYYQCLQREITALQSSRGRPDLSGIPANERSSIENACNYTRQFRGPAEYYQCLQREVAALQSSRGRPDLSGIPANERNAIENACNYTRQFRGPAEYYQCLQREVAALQRFSRPTKGLTATEPKPEPARRPTEKASDEKGIQQTEEVIIDSEKSPGKQTIPSKEALGSNPFPDSTTRRQLEKATGEKGKERREKTVDRKTTIGKYEPSPKEELGKEPFADAALPKLPQATPVAEARIPARPVPITQTSERFFLLLLA